MPSVQESLSQLVTAFDTFLNVTLNYENLSKSTEKERSKLISLLKTVCSNHEEILANKIQKKNANAKTLPREDSVSSVASSLSNSDSNVDNSDGPQEFAPTTLKALSDPIKIGFLQMKLSGGKKKPYCVLHRDILYWFTKPSDRQQEGAMCVKNYDFKVDEKKISKKNFSFELTSPGKKSYQFVADSQEDLESWRKAIQTAHTIASQKDQAGKVADYVNFNPDKSPKFSHVKAQTAKMISASNANETDKKSSNVKQMIKQLETECDDGLLYEVVDSPAPAMAKSQAETYEMDGDRIYEPASSEHDENVYDLYDDDPNVYVNLDDYHGNS